MKSVWGYLIALLLLASAVVGFADKNAVQEDMVKTTVLIFNQTGGGMSIEGWLGSGVIVSEDGYIVTNRHVVGYYLQPNGTDKQGKDLYVIKGADPHLVVYHEDWGYGGCRIVAVSDDPLRDLAVIKIEPSEPLKFATVASVENMFAGDVVYARGHPLGVGWVLTRGTITKFLKTEDQNRFLLHDASINPGNSGGPLYDEFGHVVGLNYAAIPPFFAENMAVAIDARVVARFIELAIRFDQMRMEVLSETSFEETKRTYYYDGTHYHYGGQGGP